MSHRLPANPVGASFGDAHAVADGVDAVLTDDIQAGRIHEATGPRPLSFAQAAEELAAATGRTIFYMWVSPERYAALLAGHEVTEHAVVRLRRVIDKLVDGRDTRLTAGVERASGRESRLCAPGRQSRVQPDCSSC